MELIIDANVLFAALIRKSHTRHILVSSGWTFYVPEFVFEEMRKHLLTLTEKTGLSARQMDDLLRTIMIVGAIRTIPRDEFKAHLQKAIEISPDPDDVPYLALALYKCCAIWSNDKELQKQGAVKIYTSKEIVRNEF